MNIRQSFRRFSTATALAAAASVMATAAAGPAAAAETEATSTANQEVVPLVQPSVVYETITFKGLVFDPLLNKGEYLRNYTNWSVTVQCTGFVVNSDGWVATAGHCVDMQDAKRAIAEKAAQWAVDTDFYAGNYSVDELADSYRVDLWDSESETLTKNKASRDIEVSWSQTVSGNDIQKKAPARLLASQKFELGDAALLKVEADGLNALPLADDETPAINTEVMAVGYPGVIESYTDPDLVPTFNAGTISSLKTVADGLLSVLQLSVGLEPGMSGGPTVNLSGEVVGLNSAGYDGTMIKYAVPVERIKELMASEGVSNDVSDTTVDYRAGIRAFYAADKEQAVTLLTAVVDAQPGNELAIDHLQKAKELPDPATPSTMGLNADVLTFAGVAVLALIMVGVLGLMALRSRRSGRGAQPQQVTPATEVPQETPVEQTVSIPVAAGAASGFGPTAQASVGAARPEDARRPVGFGPTADEAPHQEVPRNPAPEAAYCPQCGSGARPGSAFCSNCGSSLH